MSNSISEDCSSGLHDYCTPCECDCHIPKEINDSIREASKYLFSDLNYPSIEEAASILESKLPPKLAHALATVIHYYWLGIK